MSSRRLRNQTDYCGLKDKQIGQLNNPAYCLLRSNLPAEHKKENTHRGGGNEGQSKKKKTTSQSDLIGPLQFGVLPEHVLGRLHWLLVFSIRRCGMQCDALLNSYSRVY